MSQRKKMDVAELLGELTDTMAHWEGEDIATTAAEILGHPVEYLGDSQFGIEDTYEN